jgi:hypothetical protein
MLLLFAAGWDGRLILLIIIIAGNWYQYQKNI